MADPRQLHLNGIGSIDQVASDWKQSLANGVDDTGDCSGIIDDIVGYLKSDAARPCVLALACAHFNGNLDQHARLLRVNDAGELTISDRLIGPDLQMMKDFLSAI